MKKRCVVVLPGGGFHKVNMTTEGLDVVEFLREHEIESHVYRYKTLDEYSLQECIIDLQEYISLLKTEYDSVGVCGFSAGAYLASHLISICDFAILTYGILNLELEWNHHGSLEFFSSMFKKEHSELHEICPITQLEQSSCKVLLYHSVLDFIVHPLNSILFHRKLKELKMESEIYISRDGKHGDGMNSPEWSVEIMKFMKKI